MTFPSDEWFEALVSGAERNQEELRALGFANFRLVVEVVDSGEARHFGLVLDGYDVEYTGEFDDAGVDAFAADATITGPAEIWTDMVDNISAGGRADARHTLNALSIAEAPLRVHSDDPMGRDKFFRYAETLQTIFDATAHVPPHLAPMPVR